MKFDIRYANHPDDSKKYDTETLREKYLIEKLFEGDEILGTQRFCRKKSLILRPEFQDTFYSLQRPDSCKGRILKKSLQKSKRTTNTRRLFWKELPAKI